MKSETNKAFEDDDHNKNSAQKCETANTNGVVVYEIEKQQTLEIDKGKIQHEQKETKLSSLLLTWRFKITLLLHLGVVVSVLPRFGIPVALVCMVNPQDRLIVIDYRNESFSTNFSDIEQSITEVPLN